MSDKGLNILQSNGETELSESLSGVGLFLKMVTAE